MTESLELYPRLVVADADAALDFYARALGGTVTERFAGPDGKVVHAMVEVGSGTAAVRVAVKEGDAVDPVPVGGVVGVVLALYSPDVDALAARMVEAGAEVVIPVTDHDYGDRAGRLRDPFGHLWMVAQRLTGPSAEGTAGH